MKRFLIIVGIVIALALIIFAGKLLFKHFITDQIMDGGDMRNPDYIRDSDMTSIVEPMENDVRNNA